jgi:hypothetical protein
LSLRYGSGSGACRHRLALRWWADTGLYSLHERVKFGMGGGFLPVEQA